MNSNRKFDIENVSDHEIVDLARAYRNAEGAQVIAELVAAVKLSVSSTLKSVSSRVLQIFQAA